MTPPPPPPPPPPPGGGEAARRGRGPAVFPSAGFFSPRLFTPGRGPYMLLRDWPPSTVQEAPVTRLARSDARNATTAATSSGFPKRPRGKSDLVKAAMPSGPACFSPFQAAPGNHLP